MDGVGTPVKRWDGQRAQIWVMRMWTLLDLLEGDQEIIGSAAQSGPCSSPLMHPKEARRTFGHA
jgi:hypothetical protein